MSPIACPICLGQSFFEFRGREYAQCATCDSLERHRLFKLFLLWTAPLRTRLLLSSVGPLEELGQYEDWLIVDRLDKVSKPAKGSKQERDTCLFLENIVGYRGVDNDEKVIIRAMMEAGSLIAFTCHSGSDEKRKEDILSLLGADIECHHFDPRAIYGESVSDQFGLNLSSKLRGKGDIFYCYAAQSDDELGFKVKQRLQSVCVKV